MLKHGAATRPCKASNFEASPTKGLGVIASPSALALTIGFFAVTCFVLFKDVADGAKVTTDHVMSFAVLVGTFASGHLLTEQLRQRHLLAALGLLILFVAGTFYCVTASGGRNAATSGEKAELVHKSNDDRARLEADLKQALDRLNLAQEGEEAECATGDGVKCQGRRKTRQERETYAQVIKGQLLLMDPAKSEYPELRHAAKVFASIVLIDEQTIFDRLVLWFPFVKALFCEAATLVFGSIAIRHRPSEASLSSLSAKETVSPQETRTRKRGETVTLWKPEQSLGFLPRKPFSKDEALADLLAYIARNGSMPSQETLRARYGIRSKGTISKWLSKWETHGHIRRRQIGRCKSISAQ